MKIELTLSNLATWHAAHGKFGVDNELGMACEELSETITAVQHLRRARRGAADRFIEELADGLVCVLQIVESDGLWDELHEAMVASFQKLDDKLLADNLNAGHDT